MDRNASNIHTHGYIQIDWLRFEKWKDLRRDEKTTALLHPIFDGGGGGVTLGVSKRSTDYRATFLRVSIDNDENEYHVKMN